MLEKLSGPVIGAVIGYCTNYIAVKMLFYPRKEIRILGHALPFTPGAIPKGKPRLAKAVGNVVANTLLTADDIREKIFSEELEQEVVEKTMHVLSMDLHSMMMKSGISEEQYDAVRTRITDAVTEQVMTSIENIGVGDIIAVEGKRIIKDKVGGSMIGMLLSDDLLNSVIQPVGQEMEKYITENGESYIRPEILTMAERLEESSPLALCRRMEVEEEAMQRAIVSVYHQAADTVFDKIVKKFNIAEIIEDKINRMSVEELEKLVFTVMKKELDVIVNLGALIGGLLGIFNMLF